MKTNKLIIMSSITVLFILVLSLIAVESSHNPRLCHTWELPEYDTQITFSEDGSGFINGVETFRWNSGSGYVQIIPDTIYEMADPVNYKYTISKNGKELTITNLNDVHEHGKIIFSRL